MSRPNLSAKLDPNDWIKLNPSPPTLSSADLHWPHIQVYRLKNPSRWQLKMPAAICHNVIAHLATAGDMSTRWGGVSRHSRSSPGNIAIMSAGQESYWDWTGEIDELHIFMDPEIIASAAREVTDRPFELIDGIALVDSTISEIALKLNAELVSPGLCSRLFACSIAQTLALQLLRQHSTLSRPDDFERLDMPKYKLRAAFDFIDAHVSEDISLESIASAVYMSPFRFARGFKKATGRGPHQYVVWRRIERAKELLRATDARISDIARRTGFFSHSHFTAVFVRQCRITPKRYREIAKV